MVKKIFDKTKSIIKDNLLFLILLAVISFLSLYKLPYYISYTGGLIDTTDRVSIEGSYESEGSFNMAYVNEVRANIPMYLLSKVLKNWDAEKEEDVVYDNMTYEELVEYGKISMRESNKDAIEIAYTKAGKTYEESNAKTVVLYKSSECDTDLEIGDVINKIDDKEVSDFDSISSYIKKQKVGDKLTFTVTNNDKEYTRYAKIIEIEGEPKIGIILRKTRDVKVDPDCKLSYSENESGSSGGLMTTLTIYNDLVKEDLTHGLKIAGTGTIEADGIVGEIAGVKYKLAGAVKNKAKIFFVPAGDNYEEAVKYKKENNYKIKIVAVSTFDEAVEYLENYEK